MADPVQILGSYWTLAVGADPSASQHCPHDFRTRVETAARAGFTAMGFWHADIAEVRKTHTLKEMKQILAANGIVSIDGGCSTGSAPTRAGPRMTPASCCLMLPRRSASASRSAISATAAPCRDDGEFALLCASGDAAPTCCSDAAGAVLARAVARPGTAITRGSGAKNGGIMLDNLRAAH
jgi:hypothetical protein